MSKYDFLKILGKSVAKTFKVCQICGNPINVGDVYYREQLVDTRINFIGKKICSDCYKEPGAYNVKLSVIDNKTFTEEYITRKIEIKKEGIIPKIIKVAEEAKEKLELISTEIGEKVTDFGRTMRDWVLIKVKHSSSAPAGLINVHFEQAIEDIDLTQMTADMNSETKKSVLFMPQWPVEIEASKILFIPK